MARYRKKPVVVEATQWRANERRFSGLRLPPLSNERDDIKVYCVAGGGRYYIDTLEGSMQVRDGDWIITGIEGERYACKDSVFQATYEPMDS